MDKNTSNFSSLKVVVVLGTLTLFFSLFSSLPNIAGMLGLSTSAAGTVYNIFQSYSDIAMAASIVGAFTGVGTIEASMSAAILYVIKKKAKAKAVAF